MSEGWDEDTDELHTRVLVTPAEAFSPHQNEPRPTLESLPKSIRTISKASGSEWESEDTELAPSLRGIPPWPSSQRSAALEVEREIESTPRMPWIARTTPEPNGFRPVEVADGSPFRRSHSLALGTSAPQHVPPQANSLWHLLRGRVAHGLPIAVAVSMLTLGLVLVTTWGHSDVRVDRLVAAFIDPSRDPRYEPASTVESAPQPLPAVLPIATVESAPQPLPAAPASVVAAPESPVMPLPTTSAPNVAPVVALENPRPKPVLARTKPTGKPFPAKGAPKQTPKKTRGISAAEDLAQRQLLQSAL